MSHCCRLVYRSQRPNGPQRRVQGVGRFRAGLTYSFLRVLTAVALYWTRRMYWRRASIQDGQAPGDATVLKRLFHDKFVFHCRSKRIAFSNQWMFIRVSVCKFSIFVMVMWPLFGTLQRPTFAKCLVTDSPDKENAHLPSLCFPSVPLVWGKTVSCRLCAGQSKGTAKNAKKCCFFWIWLRPRYKFRNFSR